MVESRPTSANGWADPELAARVRAIHDRIAAAARRAGRESSDVRLVAVTKTVPIERILAAAALGLTIFGENRVQEARDKREALSQLAQRDADVGRLLAQTTWHLIGHLQTNKAARAVALFDRIQSVDSVRLAEALNGRAQALGRALPILLEVNAGGEPNKSGFAPDAVDGAAREIGSLPSLRIEGLMTVAPLAAQPEEARPIFRQLRRLREHLRDTAPLETGIWNELSMGMSDDFEVAVEEGATLVRIGRGIFGARPAPDEAQPDTDRADPAKP